VTNVKGAHTHTTPKTFQLGSNHPKHSHTVFCRSNQIRVAGCKGRSKYDFTPVCKDCQKCPVGKYIAESACGLQEAPDPSSGNPEVMPPPTCQDCPACPSGKYLSKQCSGETLGAPDHICQACAKCPVDFYAAPCTQRLPSPSTADNATYNTGTLWLPKPADADVCLPCSNCPTGSYISHRCTGSGTSDTRQCTPCDERCPDGFYMHSRCAGSTFNADSNDCR
jgi:hypothetical protein